MVGWHHQLDGHEFEQAPRVSDGQGSLVCCSPWDHKEPDITATELNWILHIRVGLFLAFQFCPIDLGVCFSVNFMLS